VAFSYDAANNAMYKSILEGLKKHYGNKIDFIYGTNEVIKTSNKYLNTELFKAQNNDLLNKFYNNIRRSDVVITDLTYNNPNVHVELGIALSLNKNILRVSSRNVIELGSDIKGYSVNIYKNRMGLNNIIKDYLDAFLKIKELSIDDISNDYYKCMCKEGYTISHRVGAQLPFYVISKMRDVAMRVTFKFNEVESEDNWFGINIRCLDTHPFAGSNLLYIRSNGTLDLIKFPQLVERETHKYKKLKEKVEYKLYLEVDGDHILARLNNFSSGLDVSNIYHQNNGTFAFSCYNSSVSFRNIEYVCRDAIDAVYFK
jgi:hypothetical protein